jgi:hypothetical protein
MVDGAADDNPVHGAADDNPTNLHYFHGGIVTPRNSRDFGDGDARGDPTNLGDNVYVHLKTSRKLQNQSTGEFNVPIPGEGKLDARVLEAEKEETAILPIPLALAGTTRICTASRRTKLWEACRAYSRLALQKRT